MAKTTVGASVEVEYKSVGELRKAVKEATGDVIRMQQQFGATSKEALAAAKRVAELKDRVKEAGEVADLFDPGNKFKALGNTVQVAANGFTALQGAMGLMGVESKDLEKQLLKVQSAMALSQSLSALADSGKEFSRLGAIIKTQVVTAFTTLRGAIVATGIGALVVALGLVITNFDEFKKAVFNLVPGLEKITKFIGNLVTRFTDFVGITSQAERNLEKITKANNKLIETIDAQIKILEAQGGKEAEIYQKKKERIEAELNNLRESLKVKGKLSAEEQKQFRELKLQQQILDIEETKRRKKVAEDRAKDTKDAYDKELEKQKAANEKKRKEEQEHREKLKKEEDDWNEYVNKTLQEEKDKEDKQRADVQAELDAADKRESDRQQKRVDDQLEYNKAVIAAENDLNNAKFEAAQAGIGLLSGLVGKNKALSETLFAVDRGLAIAKVVIDTQKEIAGYYANPTWKLLPDGGTALATAAAAKAKIRAGISIATIAAASISRYMGGGSANAGGSVPSFDKGAPVAPTLSPVAQAQAVNANAINQLGTQSFRAYVLNSDIQNNEQRNAYLQRNASIS